MINMFDPNSMTQTTLINNLMNWTALMIFFSMDGHHVLIRGIRYSFELIPIGKSFIDNNIDYIINIFVQCFLTGFKIAIPIVLCLLMADFILGLISKCTSTKCNDNWYAIKNTGWYCIIYHINTFNCQSNKSFIKSNTKDV